MPLARGPLPHHILRMDHDTPPPPAQAKPELKPAEPMPSGPKPHAPETAPSAVKPDPLLFASYNVHKGVGLDMKRDPSRTAQVIAEIAPDAIALQEADRRFGARTGVLDLEEIRERTGLEPIPLTDRLGRAAHGWHGNLVLMRNAELEDVRPVHLPGLEPRGAVMVDARLNGQPLRLIAAHLGLLRSSRLLQTQLLSRLQDEAEGRPTVLMGDLNEWRRAPFGALAPLRNLGGDGRSVPTYPARRPFLPLDRIYTCQNAELLDLHAHQTPLSRIASDHLPLTARIRLGVDAPPSL